MNPESGYNPSGDAISKPSDYGMEHYGFETALEKIEPSLEKLLIELKPGIEEGRWDSILGDDVSGRIPAYFFGQIINRYAQEHGQTPPKRLYIAGGRDMAGRLTKIEDYIEKIKDDIGDRTLVVTEYVSRGDGISPLVRLLWSAGVEPEIATVNFANDPDGNFERTRERTLGKVKTYDGGLGNQALAIYNSKKATGVMKPGKAQATTHATRTHQGLVNYSREVVQDLADQYYEKYFGEQEKKEAA